MMTTVHGGNLRAGFQLPQGGPGAEAPFVRDFVLHARGCGAESFFVGEHILTGGYDHRIRPGQTFLDPLVLQAFVAGVEPSVQLGTSVLVVPYRHPLVLMKGIASVAHLTKQRVSICVGTGWAEAEFNALGVDFHQRGRLTDQFCDIFTRLRDNPTEPWTVGPYTYHGSGFEPLVPPRVELWVGGESPAALRRAGRWATGWQPSIFGPGFPASRGPAPTDYQKMLQVIREACDANGRSVDFVGAVKLRLRLGEASRDAELTDLFGSYREAGATDFLFEVACRNREYAFDAVQRVMGCFKQLR